MTIFGDRRHESSRLGAGMTLRRGSRVSWAAVWRTETRDTGILARASIVAAAARLGASDASSIVCGPLREGARW
jgi:hypothetical protein